MDHRWDPVLATRDSDGDGFTNGEELQDPAGAWSSGQANPGNSALVTDPDSATAYPPAPSMTAFTGISAGSSISGTRAVAVSLSTASGGNAVGITRVEYRFLTAGTSTVITTFQTTTSPFGLNINTQNVPNGNYDVVAICFDKRAAGQGGARTAAITRTNVTVANLPTISAQPQSTQTTPGGNASFSVTASGGTLTYQWRKDSVNLTNTAPYSNVTTATLNITGAAAAQVGLYDVVVSNSAGSTTSQPASLFVGVQESNSNVRLVSVTPGGASGNAGSQVPDTVAGGGALNRGNRVISGDGRYVAFVSSASDLVQGITTAGSQAFRRDLKAGTTQLVSTSTATAVGGNMGVQSRLIISDDGRYVAFMSRSTDMCAAGLNPPDTQNRCYRRDMNTGTILPIGVVNGPTTSSASYGASNSEIVAISADGRYCLFFYDGTTQLDPAKDNNAFADYYVRDFVAETTTLVNVNSAANGSATGGVSGGVMSADGRYVVFTSSTGAGVTVEELIVGVEGAQVYRWDRSSPNAVQLVSATTNTTTTEGNNASINPAIASNDGNFIAFQAVATNLNPGDSDAAVTIYRRNMLTNATEIVNQIFNSTNASSFAATGATISGDGRYIGFVSDDADLIGAQAATDNNTFTDIFRRDMNDITPGKNKIISAPNNSTSATANNTSTAARISDDGRYIVFASTATNLVGMADGNGMDDVFRRDCDLDDTILMSIRADLGGASMNGGSTPFLSGNGQTTLFNSGGADLSIGDANGATDVFLATFNVAPVVAAFTGATINLGDSYARAGTYSDANGQDNHTARVDYGDGTGLQTLTLNGTNNTFSLSHQYNVAGTFTVRVLITDTANTTTQQTATVTVIGLSTTTSLVSSASPNGFEQPLTFTATVGGAITGVPLTGIVTFKAGNTDIGSAEVSSSGVAALTISPFPTAPTMWSRRTAAIPRTRAAVPASWRRSSRHRRRPSPAR